MHARVAVFEGDPDALKRSVEEIRSRSASGPPEGVPAKGFTMLFDADKGRAIGISLFETEDDLRQGHETLNGMSPPEDGMTRQGSVDFYEVAVDVRT